MIEHKITKTRCSHLSTGYVKPEKNSAEFFLAKRIASQFSLDARFIPRPKGRGFLARNG